MQSLAALVIAIPLIIAALLVAMSKFPRAAIDAVAIATALGVTVAAMLLLNASSAKTIVYWFGGWTPRNGIAIGICFSIDPLSAGLASLVAFLVTVSLIFAWRYFDSLGSLFHSLMLVFLAAMVGFCLSGDIFTLFVFFELMSVIAFALTGYKIEASSIEGALNFAIVNSIGAFLTLWGIALVYGRTGALNFAQLGRALARMPNDGIVLAAFVLIACGFLVKAAVVPFHFWLADAHAVAPTPVCVLFSGVMVELGVFGVFRVYWTVFEPALRLDEAKLRAVFLCLGAMTAVVGAVMCFWQRHIKRLLAFSTISHVGIILAGCGTLSARGLAGASLYVLGHAMVKGSLFMSAGIFLQRFGTMDEIELSGRGRQWKWMGIVVAIAGLGLAGFPPFGTYLGKSLMDESARSFGQGWVIWIFSSASALTGAAVLRGAARVFLGWGGDEQEQRRSPTEHEKKETSQDGGKLPVVMVATAASMAVLPLFFGFQRSFSRDTEAAAERFIQGGSYSAAVLDGRAEGAIRTTQTVRMTWEGVIIAYGTALAAIGIAMLDLFSDRLPSTLARKCGSALEIVLGPLRRLHSGDFRDYVAWLTLGTTLFGMAIAWTLH
jgi:multicomponent Na+:H+ antiporter subunit D